MHIWADAVPLNRFIEDVATRTLSERVPALPKKVTPAISSSNAEMLSQYLLANIDLMGAKSKAQNYTINNLIAGRLVGIGRHPKTYDVEKINAAFWVGGAIGDNSVSRDGVEWIDVRIVPADALPTIKSEAPRILTTADVIRAAIAEYAKTDPKLSQPPSIRHRAYRTYITSTGIDLRKDRGFGAKTFEKYETEFRSLIK